MKDGFELKNLGTGSWSLLAPHSFEGNWPTEEELSKEAGAQVVYADAGDNPFREEAILWEAEE